MLYSINDVDMNMIKQCRIFCHGSNSLVYPSNRSATLSAAKHARQCGALVIYDPNIRLNLWDSESSAKEIIPLAIPGADIIKLSEEELSFITGCTDIDLGIKSLLKLGAKVVIITRGSKECHYSWGQFRGYVPTAAVQVVDATGAGDAFLAGLLYQLSLSNTPIEKYDESDISKILTFAHAVARLCVGCRGAIPAMPTLNRVKSSLSG
jgi:fructokinase